MSGRLVSSLLVTALIRRVQDAGGTAAVLSRGDATAGAILIVATERGANPRFFERGIGPNGAPALIRSGPSDVGDAAADAYRQRRAARDPDLWIVELDIAQAERFAAETIAGD